MVSASGNAASPNTTTLATPKSRENAANCEMIIRPPVDIMVIMKNISQNTGLRSIWPGGVPAFAASAGGGGNTSADVGIRIASAAAAPTTPRMRPNTTRVC